VRHRHHEILIEEVQDHLAIPQVIETTMVQDQAPKVFKFSNREISALSCSLSFITKQSNAYMSLFDHAHIIRSVPDCQCDQLRIVISDQLYNLGLLSRV